MSRKSRVVYLYLEKKIGLLERGACLFSIAPPTLAIQFQTLPAGNFGKNSQKNIFRISVKQNAFL